MIRKKHISVSFGHLTIVLRQTVNSSVNISPSLFQSVFTNDVGLSYLLLVQFNDTITKLLVLTETT